MSREATIIAIDLVLRTGFAIWAIFCVRHIWRSFKRGHVFINGQPAARDTEPLGFWLVVLSLFGVVYLSAYVVFNGL